MSNGISIFVEHNCLFIKKSMCAVCVLLEKWLLFDGHLVVTMINRGQFDQTHFARTIVISHCLFV